MRRLGSALVAAALAALLLAPSSQAAQFGLKGLDVRIADAQGLISMQAGSHPFGFTTAVEFNTEENPELGGEVPAGMIRNLSGELPVGLTGSPFAVPQCPAADFVTTVEVSGIPTPSCSNASVIGLIRNRVSLADGEVVVSVNAVYNLVPPPGVAARLGFLAYGGPVPPTTVDIGVNPDPPFNLTFAARNVTQMLRVHSAELTTWGNPAAPVHDGERGNCGLSIEKEGSLASTGGDCPTSNPNRPFLTLPRSCTGPLSMSFLAESWLGELDEGIASTHDDAEPPNPLGMGGCAKLAFAPAIAAEPTAQAATSPTGLDFNLDFADEGITSPGGLAGSDLKKAVVTLPEGMSVNPSQAEGLEVCSEAQLAKETAFSEFGAGCPAASKIGSTEVESPLLEDQVLKGSVFVAKPYENPFGSLLALYVTVKDPELGIGLRLAGRAELDSETGQITTTFEDLPQQPFSHFRLHFREGTRSPLVTPPACGSYDVKAELTPWSGADPITTTSTFEVITGPGEGPCPKGGLPPFKPGLIAGTVNNRAGGFSPFNLRLSRTDSEQEITHFSIKLPPGIVGKLAGIPYCPDAAIAAAKARTGPQGGHEELNDPSCPKASEIGRTLAGAGVGPALTYAPGKVYLAGPYHGSNLSMVAITAGVVGPFDIGTVVVREGFKIDPETAEVFIDATGSDPIPHIVLGVPVHLRDIRAYVDRPQFVLNPTDCTRTSTASTVLGSGLDFVSEADDNPITVTSPFQAADCAALPFAPQLGLRLIGGTKRGAHPAFKAHLQMNGIGEAGIAYSQVTLPRSEFIENAHFKTICTRVQFKAGAGNGVECPAGSIYGKAKAVTPILGEPLTGPVFLRSSEHQLPDLVVALHNSQVDFDLVSHVDSVKGGGLRNTFEAAPDAPVSSFDLEMAGGKKGLFVNSTDLCAKTYRAKAVFTGQNGKVYKSKPALRAKCKGKGKGSKRHKRAARRHGRATK